MRDGLLKYTNARRYGAGSKKQLFSIGRRSTIRSIWSTAPTMASGVMTRGEQSHVDSKRRDGPASFDIARSWRLENTVLSSAPSTTRNGLMTACTRTCGIKRRRLPKMNART